MKPFLKIDKKVVEISDTAAWLYAVLVYADFKKKTYSRAYLAKALGVNDLDYVTELLREIEDAGLIKRSFVYGNEYMNGHISKELRVKLIYDVCEDCDVNWFPVNLGIIGLEGASKDKGFALKLRALAFDDTLKIGYNKKDLAGVLGISAPTLRKKLQKVATLIDDTMTVNGEYFPVCERCYLDEKNIQFVKDVLSADKDSKMYKQVMWFLQNKCHLRRDCNKVMESIQAGIVGLKRAKKPVFYGAEFSW